MKSAKLAKQRLLQVLDMDRSKLGYTRRGPICININGHRMAAYTGETITVENRGFYRIEGRQP